ASAWVFTEEPKRSGELTSLAERHFNHWGQRGHGECVDGTAALGVKCRGHSRGVAVPHLTHPDRMVRSVLFSAKTFYTPAAAPSNCAGSAAALLPPSALAASRAASTRLITSVTMSTGSQRASMTASAMPTVMLS